MGTDVFLHSMLNANGELSHNIQTPNMARMKQIVRLLTQHGYEIVGSIGSDAGYHYINLWSLQDRIYTSVPRSDHTALQRLLRISVNNLHQRPTIISSYANLPSLRTRKSMRPTSPRRLSL